MEHVLNEFSDSLFSLFVFIAIIILITSAAYSSRENCNIVASSISSKASSSLTLPIGQETLYISAGEALFDTINMPDDVAILINGTFVDAEWINGARMHDEYALSVLKSIFSNGVWKKVSIVGNNGHLEALEFWRGGITTYE